MKIRNIFVNPSEYYRYYSGNVNKSIDFNKISSNNFDLNPNRLKILELL